QSCRRSARSEGSSLAGFYQKPVTPLINPASVTGTRERAQRSEPRERSAPAKRRARERVGESEGRSPSEKDRITDCHEGHPARRRQRDAAATAHGPHAQADRPHPEPAVPVLPDRSPQADSGDRRSDPQPQLPAAPH